MLSYTAVPLLLLALCASAKHISPRGPSNPFTRNEKTRSSLLAGDIVEGDIRLNENLASFYRGESRNAMKDVKLWPNGVVPYVLDSSVDDYLKEQILIGVEEYTKYTCIKIVPRTNERDYIRIVKPSSGCNSMVGVVGGEQVLNMGPGCEYVGLVVHEFGHAIGYFHEHNRPDRDDTVRILWENIQSGFKDAFTKYTFDEADTQGFPYDLTSIMHYENGAFSGGYCRPTMLVKEDPSYEVRPVYKRKFSPQDIKKINKLYGCKTDQLPPEVLPGTNNPDPSQCPCKDLYEKCNEWKEMGECGNNLSWMSRNCPKSCRTCGEPPSDCQDLYPVACETWGKAECELNAMWMSDNCKKTCDTCIVDPGECRDRFQKCSSWSDGGHCSETFQWMNIFCNKSCRVCGEPDSDCQDTYPVACEDWEKQGECEKNPNWMGKNCEKTCKTCDGGGATQPPAATTQPPPPPTDGSTRPPVATTTMPPPTDGCEGATQPPAATTQPPPPPTDGSTRPPVPTDGCEGTTTSPSVVTTQPGDCKDVYPQYCPDYKKQGMCETHPDYTKEVCKYTCGYCDVVTSQPNNCKDVYPQYCPDYKKQGMCETHPDYTKEVCKYTCGYCGA